LLPPEGDLVYMQETKTKVFHRTYEQDREIIGIHCNEIYLRIASWYCKVDGLMCMPQR